MKAFELLSKTYVFHGETRKLLDVSSWHHYRGYTTEYGVNQAIEVRRKQTDNRYYCHPKGIPILKLIRWKYVATF